MTTTDLATIERKLRAGMVLSNEQALELVAHARAAELRGRTFALAKAQRAIEMADGLGEDPFEAVCSALAEME